MDGGLTRPFIVLAEDAEGHEVEAVLKVRTPDNADNHFGPTSLACELTCSILAKALGFSVPDYAVVQVSDELAAAVSDAAIRATLTANIGPNFGSRLLEGVTDWDEDHQHATPEVLQLLEDVMCFDSVALNDDRRAGRPNLLWRGQELTLIDHSLALTVFTWRPGGTNHMTLLTDAQVREHCAFKALANKGRTFAELAGRWGARIDAADLQAARAAIPAEWETTPGHLDQIFGFLNLRHIALESIRLGLARVVQ
jgi:HipA-like protein